MASSKAASRMNVRRPSTLSKLQPALSSTGCHVYKAFGTRPCHTISLSRETRTSLTDSSLIEHPQDSRSSTRGLRSRSRPRAHRAAPPPPQRHRRRLRSRPSSAPMALSTTLSTTRSPTTRRPRVSLVPAAAAAPTIRAPPPRCCPSSPTRRSTRASLAPTPSTPSRPTTRLSYNGRPSSASVSVLPICPRS